MTDPADLAKLVNEVGCDATLEELMEADREMRAEQAKKTDETEKELSAEELGAAAGGREWAGEDAPDGHELGCTIFYHYYWYQANQNLWCKNMHYCNGNRLSEIDYSSD